MLNLAWRGLKNVNASRAEAKIDHQLMLNRNLEYSMNRAASEAKAA